MLIKNWFLTLKNVISFKLLNPNNMKKTLLTIATMVAGILTMNAQCVIAPTCTVSSSGYCATPSASTNLSAATIGTAYNDNIQLSLGSTAQTQLGPVTVHSATVTNVVGMPAGILATKNPTTGAIMANASGCIGFAGTSTAPAGTYTIGVTVVITASQNSGPQFNLPAQTFNWYLPLNASTTGINTIANTTTGVLVLAPNPAKSELTLTSDLHLAKATIIDALGKVVMVQELNYANQAIIDVRSLETGIYFLQANDGSKTITKKFIKD